MYLVSFDPALDLLKDYVVVGTAFKTMGSVLLEGVGRGR